MLESGRQTSRCDSRPTGLRCEHQIEPLVLATLAPVLSPQLVSAAHLRTWPERDDWPLVDASRHGDHGAIAVCPDGPATPRALVSAAMVMAEFRCAAALALQKGPAPAFKVEGAGSDAKVVLGKRTVCFADGRLILE